MQLNLQSIWVARLVSLVLAGLATGSAAYWILQRPVHEMPLSAPVLSEDALAPAGSELARLLGRVDAAPTPELAPVINGRFALTGVLAGSGQHGAALISVDGAVAKAYKVGDRVADALYLQSVARRSAILAQRADSGAVTVLLEMKPLTR